MKLLLLVVIGVFLIFRCLLAEATANDLDALQGTWQATAAVDGGTPEYASGVALLQLKIKGDHYMYDFGDHSFSADFKIDPTKAPKEMDVTFLEGPQVGKTMKAIYSLEGDALKICAGPYGRPTEFVSTLEAQSLLFTFQRDGPSKDITSAEILGYGIYTTEPLNTPVQRTKDGVPSVQAIIRPVEQKLNIPAALDTHFGFQYVVHGVPKGKRVALRHVLLHPPTTDEVTGKTTSRSEISLETGLEETNTYAVYKLQSRSDLVLGTWTVQIFDHDQKLLEKSFTLVKP